MVQLLRKLILKHFIHMRWYSVVLALLFYAFSSWILLEAAQEHALTRWPDFLYWLLVTGSTVGYGDLSPQTDAGKLITSLFVIPFGLSIFALIVGRAAAWLSQHWQRGIKGMKKIDLSQHIVVIGWQGERTMQLLKLLIKERQDANRQQGILLCVKADIENPMPGQIEFVRVGSFCSEDDMQRASIDDAAVIIIDHPQDDETMTTALYCHQRNPENHLLVYFQDETLSNLLKLHCPNVECTPSVAVEMLAKSAFDPGSSALHHDLLSVADNGQAQYSTTIPLLEKPLNVQQLFSGLKQHYDATFIGLGDSHKQIKLNPSFETVVNSGDKVFYIASQRLKSIEWERFYV
ncbi:potassium channel family protein [Neptunicella marina]|uniref:Potassium channel protein n=1 Tax=Neptunicella marina TaxID=2125989 RepID=A0A8J6IPG6_9ALTE|nr:potassium channel family protein [Neptunicella marina]MBC3764761.1 potassium channel protein [Neptunicella marina]